MKKLSILIQWVLVAGFLGFAVYALLQKRPVPVRNTASWRGWQGFMTLAYPGLDANESDMYTTPKQLERHLQALQEAGYRTITPEDALAFIKEEAPLPPKALLLLFEGGRKDSVVYTVKPFQNTGFSGTLCLPSRVMRSRGAFFLHRRDLQRIAKLGFWQFAGMGDHAIDEISTGPDGETGHFLTQRMWTEAGQESLEAFQERVATDYADCVKAIEEETGIHPIAYVYPFADAGRGPEADPEAERINREEVTRHFDLAFVQAHNPFNGPGRDPFNLTRLRVPGRLTGEELVQELERYAPQFDAMGEAHDASFWQVDGTVQFALSGMEISPHSAAWLRGSESWTDVDIRTTLQITPDTTAAVYVRYTSQKSYLRVTLTPTGLRVQENLQGRIRTLHRHPDPPELHQPVALRLRVKGSRAWLWRGDTLLAGPLPLASELSHGRSGIGADIGSLHVEAFTATPLLTDYALADQLDFFPTEDFSSIQSLIVPLNPDGDEPSPSQRRVILNAAAQGAEMIPLLPAGAEPDEICDQLTALFNHPITRSLIHRVAIPSPSPGMLQRLHDMGLAVIAVLPAGTPGAKRFDFTQLSPRDMILLEGSEADSLSELDRLLATTPATRLIGLLDPATSRELGISRGIRYEP
jgi:hypothetical protein